MKYPFPRFAHPANFSLSCGNFGGPTGEGESSAADRARLLRTESAFQTPNNVSAEGVDQNYAAASPNDSDLGEQAILKRVESYQPFTRETGVPIYYTSNVALVDHGQVGAAITAPVVGLTYAPRFQRLLIGDFTLRQQFFYYSNDLSSFNFANFDAIAGLVYLYRSCTIWHCARTSILIDSRAQTTLIVSFRILDSC